MSGVSLRFMRKGDKAWTHVEFPPETDPFAVCQHVDLTLMGTQPAKRDRVFDRIMAERQAERLKGVSA